MAARTTSRRQDAGPTLFDALPDDDPPLVQAFRAFHLRNPHVYSLFERFALEAASAGREKIGARLIWERMRWYLRFETTDRAERGLKLNDHYPPYYARMFLRRHPELEGFFELRKVQGEAEVSA